MTRRPAAAFFDLDGTLMDREPLMQVAIERMCTSSGLVLADGEIAVLIGRAWPDVHAVLEIGPRLDLDLDAFLDLVFAEAAALVADGFPVRVLDGGAALIERLHGHGVPLMLVTGSVRSEADLAIDELGIGAFLAGSLAGDEFAPNRPMTADPATQRPGKPAPDPYLIAAASLGIDPADHARCVVFEDSTVGVASARAAGMRVIATSAANRPAGEPGHQDLTAAHVAVRELHEVTDELLATVLDLTP